MCYRLILIPIFVLVLGGSQNNLVNFSKIFERQKVIELSEDVEPIGVIKGFAVDLRGNILIGDPLNHNIKIYDQNGNLLKILGRQGKGPGEFRRIRGIDIDSNGEIYVSDMANQRISIFDSSGNFLNSFIVTESHICDHIKLYRDRIFIGGLKQIIEKSSSSYAYGLYIHIYDKKGNFIKSFYPTNKRALKLNVIDPFVAFDISKGGHIYCVQRTFYEISKYSLDGEFIKSFSRKAAFYKPVIKEPETITTVEDLGQWYEKWHQVLSLFVVDNYIIVQILTHKPSKYTIEIYNSDGHFIAGPILTSYRLLGTDHNGHLYFQVDEPPNPYKIAKYRLNKSFLRDREKNLNP